MHAIQREPIYKGATRPAMTLGVPLTPLVLLFGASLLVMVWGGLLLSGWIALCVPLVTAPVWLWMRFVTAQDDQRFRQVFVALKLRLRDRNHRIWCARSYTPNVYRGARDAWHV